MIYLNCHWCHFPFSFSFPAIYNYNASQDVELSLQIGDTVHILEMYEGESGWPSARRGKREKQWKLLINKALRANINMLYFLKGCWWKSRKDLLYNFILRVISKQPAEYMSANMPRHQNQSMWICWVQPLSAEDPTQFWLGRDTWDTGLAGAPRKLIKWLFLLSTKCCQIGGEMRERLSGVAEIPSEN